MKIAPARCLSLPGLAVAGLLSVFALPGQAQAQSAPEPARVSQSWELDFEYQQPRVLTVRDADDRVRWFWYMPYKVTNHTGEVQNFIPDVTVAYDNGAIVDADRSVPARVYSRVKERVGNPLLKTPAEAAGDMLDGADYARESVAVWEHPAGGELEPANEMRVFMAGLSGETQSIAHPTEEDETIVLTRTRMVTYRLPGKPETPRQQPVAFEEERDVMR